MVVKYAIANVTPGHLAKLGQDAGLSGSILSGYGFGEYGIEPVAFLEIALGDHFTSGRTDAFVIDVLTHLGEKAAYRVVDGARASLLYATGKREQL